MKQSKNFHSRILQTVRDYIRSALDDQLSHPVNSTRAAHLRKISKLFNSPVHHSQLFLSCSYIFFRYEVMRGFELRGCSIGPPYLQLAAS
jgi:hypothetical protein